MILPLLAGFGSVKVKSFASRSRPGKSFLDALHVQLQQIFLLELLANHCLKGSISAEHRPDAGSEYHVCED